MLKIEEAIEAGPLFTPSRLFTQMCSSNIQSEPVATRPNSDVRVSLRCCSGPDHAGAVYKHNSQHYNPHIWTTDIIPFRLHAMHGYANLDTGILQFPLECRPSGQIFLSLRFWGGQQQATYVAKIIVMLMTQIPCLFTYGNKVKWLSMRLLSSYHCYHTNSPQQNNIKLKRNQ